MIAPSDQSEQIDLAQFNQANRRSRFLTIAVVVLATALVGLGAWVVFDQTGRSETAVPAEIAQLLDDYETAFNTYDGDAFRALVTDDFVVHDDIYYTVGSELLMVSGSERLDEAAGHLESGASELYEWQIELVGEPIVAGDGPWYVSQVEHASGEGHEFVGMSTYVVVDQDGTLKVADKNWVGFRD